MYTDSRKIRKNNMDLSEESVQQLVKLKNETDTKFLAEKKDSLERLGKEVPLELSDSIYQQENMLAKKISDATEIQRKYL